MVQMRAIQLADIGHDLRHTANARCMISRSGSASAVAANTADAAAFRVLRMGTEIKHDDRKHGRPVKFSVARRAQRRGRSRPEPGPVDQSSVAVTVSWRCGLSSRIGSACHSPAASFATFLKLFFQAALARRISGRVIPPCLVRTEPRQRRS